MKKIFLIIGAPGSGKTTDASMIAQNNSDSIAHFSTGDLLRAEVQSGSELGKIIDERISAGNLVPVKIAVETIIKAIENSDKNIILIDGFPRSVEQMMALEKVLISAKGIRLVLVIEVLVSPETAKKRVLGRSRGSDDKEEIFANRLTIYNEPLSMIRDFYKNQNLLIEVDGERDVNEIVKDMETKIHEHI